MGLLEMIALAILSLFAVVGIVCVVLVTIFYVKKHKNTVTAVVEKKTKAQRDLEWANALVEKLSKKVSEENKK